MQNPSETLQSVSALKLPEINVSKSNRKSGSEAIEWGGMELARSRELLGYRASSRIRIDHARRTLHFALVYSRDSANGIRQ